MQRVTLHADRRSGRAGAWVLVINGIACASGERGSMIGALFDIMDELEIVTRVTCKSEIASA